MSQTQTQNDTVWPGTAGSDLPPLADGERLVFSGCY